MPSLGVLRTYKSAPQKDVTLLTIGESGHFYHLARTDRAHTFATPNDKNKKRGVPYVSTPRFILSCYARILAIEAARAHFPMLWGTPQVAEQNLAHGKELIRQAVVELHKQLFVPGQLL